MELTRDKIEWLAKQPVITKYSTVETEELIVIASMLLAEMDKPKVWENARSTDVKAYISYAKTEQGRPIEVASYTRELPKSLAREIAEKYFNAIENIQGCIDAINEWEARKK